MLIACGPGRTIPTPLDVHDPTVANGQALFTSACSKCHGYPDPQSESDADWPAIVEDMGEKADLAAADRKAVLQYILAAKKPRAAAPR